LAKVKAAFLKQDKQKIGQQSKSVEPEDTLAENLNVVSLRKAVGSAAREPREIAGLD
jgi:hypothetical protein